MASKVPAFARPAVRAVPPAVRRPAARGLRAVDRRVTGARAELELRRVRREHPMPGVEDLPVRLLVAPVNSAGQGWAWARVAERHGPGVTARCFALTNAFRFPTDYQVDSTVYTSEAWGRAHERYVLRTYSHVVVEAARPVFGRRYGKTVAAELPALTRAGVEVALLSHGSDTRVPSAHAEREKWSPFRDTTWDVLPRLEAGARRDAALLNAYEGHVLVSTPDMLDDLPDAVWCPVVVDADLWGGSVTTMDRHRPVVVHVPSHSRLKGSELIDPVLSDLAAAGVIDYRRMEGLSATEMVRAYREADIVVDQVRLGSYGVAACEGMAAGRVVIGHVAPHVRERVRARTGRRLPIVQAEPDTLAEVIREVIADPDAAIATAHEGVDFVRTVHDGTLVADALTPFLAGAVR